MPYEQVSQDHAEHKILSLSIHILGLAKILKKHLQENYSQPSFFTPPQEKIKAFLKNLKNFVQRGQLQEIIDALQNLMQDEGLQSDKDLLENIKYYKVKFEEYGQKIMQVKYSSNSESDSRYAKRLLNYICMNFSEKELCSDNKVVYSTAPYLRGLRLLQSTDNYVKSILAQAADYHCQKAKPYIDLIQQTPLIDEEFRCLTCVEYYGRDVVINLEQANQVKYKHLGAIHFKQLYELIDNDNIVLERYRVLCLELKGPIIKTEIKPEVNFVLK